MSVIHWRLSLSLVGLFFGAQNGLAKEHGHGHGHAHPFASEGLEEDSTTVVNSNEAAFLTNVKRITYEGLRAGESYFSPDGQWMVFQSEREKDNPFYQIYLKNLKTGETRRMSPGTGKTTCAWIHPKMNKVLFASTHLDPDAVKKQQEEIAARLANPARRYGWDYDENFDIFQANTHGKNLVNLTNAPGYDAEGSWSPDGKLIVFASNRYAYTEELSPEEQAILAKDQSYFIDLYMMRADGSQVRRLTTAPGYDGGPFFSNDGKRIIWRHFDADGSKAEVHSMRVDGSDEKVLTNLGAISWAPYFHPTGDYVVFSTNTLTRDDHAHSNFEVYLVDAEGKKAPVRVTYAEGFDGLPVFLPDGQHIAWTSVRGDGKRSQIFIAKWNDAEARRVLELPERNDEISAAEIESHVQYLASDTLEGRLTGTTGEALATDYGAKMFDKYGLKSLEAKQYYHSFEYTAGVSLDNGNRLALQTGKAANEIQLELSKDYLPLAFSKSEEFKNAEVVFAGYGIIAPKTQNFPEYNSYTHLDVKDKWVMIFRYLPESISIEHRQHLHRYADLRQKAMEARNLGALGIIVVSGPNANVNEELVPLRSDATSAGSNILGISLSDTAGNKLLASKEHSLKTLQDELDKGEAVMGFTLSTKISGALAIKKDKKAGRNVVAILNGNKKLTEAVLVGAHIDHLGKDEKGIYHGADDNASGSAAVLEIAQKLARDVQSGKVVLKKAVIFALWSGEELGLLGSSAFIKDYLEKNKQVGSAQPKIVAVLNMDMIGRLKDQLIIQGVGSSSVWPSLIEKHSAKSPLFLATQEDPYLPTDSTAFYLQKIPAINAFTGSHDDYHLPSDTFEKINYEGVENTAKLIAHMTTDLATRSATPDYILVESARGGEGTGFRVYLGTIPNYGTEVDGVLLDGVKAGSPADKAGLKKGDIIFSLAGKKIANVEEYTRVLAVLRVGEEVEVKFTRDGQEMTAKITPESRS